jgi:integrase
MTIKVPRLLKTRHGVFVLRVYFFDQNGQRRLKQYSLNTKDPATARVLALKFNLELEAPNMPRTPSFLEQARDTIANPLKLTTADGESLDFDPTNPAEAAWAKEWKAGKDIQIAALQHQARAEQGRELTLLEGIAGKLLPQAKPQQIGKPFTEATALYLIERKLDNKPATIYEKRRTYGDFVALYGDLDINQITKSEAVAWKSAEVQRGLTANRINKRLGQVNDFFNWAINNGHYTASDKSPCAGLFISKKAKLAKATEKREPFTNDEISLIFGAGYTERFFAPDHYWIPLICLFSGARREEAGDLLSANIKAVDGVLTFLIEEGKTEDARRLVPIHQMLIDLGFWDYAKARHEAGHVYLFEYRPKGMGGRGKEAGRMFSKWLRKDCAISNTRKTFHSLRHTVITRFSGLKIHPTHAMQITGHQNEHSKTVHAETYDHGAELQLLSSELNRLAYPHDFAAVKLVDPTFTAFFAKIEVRKNEPKRLDKAISQAKHDKAKEERELRNISMQQKIKKKF